MSKIILDLTMTLDGFISGPDGEIDWIVQDENTDFGDILSEILTDSLYSVAEASEDKGKTWRKDLEQTHKRIK